MRRLINGSTKEKLNELEELSKRPNRSAVNIRNALHSTVIRGSLPMKEIMDLIDLVSQVNVKKMHHRNAPDTERAAAHKVAQTLRGRRLETLQALSQLPAGGGTGDKIAQAAGLSVLSIRPRLTELQEMDLIKDTGRRAKNQWQNNEIIWQLTEAGEKICIYHLKKSKECQTRFES